MPLILNPETQARLDAFKPDIDAAEWADLWAEIFCQNPDAAKDEDYLRSIFSSAIMAGYDEARRQASAVEAQDKRTQLASKIHRETTQKHVG